MEHQWHTLFEDMDEKDWRVLLMDRDACRIQVEWLNSIETLPDLCLVLVAALVEAAGFEVELAELERVDGLDDDGTMVLEDRHDDEHGDGSDYSRAQLVQLQLSIIHRIDRP